MNSRTLKAPTHLFSNNWNPLHSSQLYLFCMQQQRIRLGTGPEHRESDRHFQVPFQPKQKISFLSQSTKGSKNISQFSPPITSLHDIQQHKPGLITLIFLLKKPLSLKHKIFVVDIINCLSKGKAKTSSEVALWRALSRFTILQIIPIQEDKGRK